MNRQSVPTKQDEDLTVKYNSFTGVMEFFCAGKKIYQKTITQCEKIFPHIIWWKIKQNQHIKYVL